MRYLSAHGGVDLDIEGPLLQCAVQHYHVISGFTGWHSNHNFDVPWLTDSVDLGRPFEGREKYRAVRIAGLAACSLNTAGRDLPHGGYGLLGVCNDSTAVVEQAIRGRTHVFPLTAIGRFQERTIHELHALRLRLQGTEDPNPNPNLRSNPHPT